MCARVCDDRCFFFCLCRSSSWKNAYVQSAQFVYIIMFSFTTKMPTINMEKWEYMMRVYILCVLQMWMRACD